MKRLFLALCVSTMMSSCSSMDGENTVIGGTVSVLPKYGVMGTEGVRITSELSGAKAAFTIVDAKLTGKDNPYVFEIRFFDLKGESVILPDSCNPNISIEIESGSTTKVYWEGSLRRTWIKTESGNDIYYYLSPIVADLESIYIKPSVKVMVRSEVIGNMHYRYRISLRSGGTK